MAKYFIYPDPNIYDTSAVTAGTISGSSTKTFTPNTSAITNVGRVTDQNIGSVISNVAQYDAIRIDLGASSSPNVIAFYHTAADTNKLEIAASNSATSYTTSDHVLSVSDDFTAGWVAHDITVSSKEYLFIYNSTADDWNYLAEIVVGTKYTFDRNYDLGGEFGAEFGVSNLESYGGIEYSHKRYGKKNTWKLEWTRLTNAQMNSLLSLRDAVEGSRFKFIYYDDSAFYWVRMSDKSLQKKEIAYQTFNTTINLKEQIA